MLPVQEVQRKSECVPQVLSVEAAVCGWLSPFSQSYGFCGRHPQQRRQGVGTTDHCACRGKILLFQSDYKHRCWSSLRVQYIHAEYSCSAEFHLDCGLSLGCSDDWLNLNTLCFITCNSCNTPVADVPDLKFVFCVYCALIRCVPP